jgi:hypothetical protein
MGLRMDLEETYRQMDLGVPEDETGRVTVEADQWEVLHPTVLEDLLDIPDHQILGVQKEEVPNQEKMKGEMIGVVQFPPFQLGGTQRGGNLQIMA